MPDKHWYYSSVLDNGEFQVYIPATISIFDCEQMEAQFAIMMRQARRRASNVPVLEDKENA